MGLRFYTEDKDVEDVLSQYGEIRGTAIRLKYVANHGLAGLQTLIGQNAAQ